MTECPAEIYIERVPTYATYDDTVYGYVWEIVQPDRHYGVWECGVEDTLLAAECKARYALARVQERQGY
jgi:hypothetical protein